MVVAESKTKYDRQLRIWGEQGQEALERASICLLNCGPTGTEALKNLVLGGIGSITVVDGSKVKTRDLGNNFLLHKESLGQSKAKCVCAFLQELNDAVKAKFVEESPETLIETKPSFFEQFTLVVATQLLESFLIRLDKICRKANVMLVVARSYGLTGIVRVSLKEHNVIESKPEHFLDDLRLHNPWPELKQFAKSIDLDVADPVLHKHVPYIVVLINVADEWANMHSGSSPSTRQEKNDFKAMIKLHMLNIDEENYKEATDAAFKVSIPRGISAHLHQIINENSAEVGSSSTDFFILVAALKQFIENDGDGELPLEGSIPDMTSSTEYYISLQKLYQAKAEADCVLMEKHVKSILTKIGRDPDSISKSYIKLFCRNARKISVSRYPEIEEEYNSSNRDLQKYLTDEGYSFAIGFYILLRAVDHFAANFNRFPGSFDSEMDEDISRLKTVALEVLNDWGIHGPAALWDDLINEMCRFGGAELHAVAALVGGVASQEVIKLVTKQFIPLRGTFIFNGVDHKSQVIPF